MHVCSILFLESERLLTFHYQMLGSVDSKPAFLFDKALEPAIKAIVRKFPTVDTKSGSVRTSCRRLSDVSSSSFLSCGTKSFVSPTMHTYILFQIQIVVLSGFNCGPHGCCRVLIQCIMQSICPFKSLYTSFLAAGLAGVCTLQRQFNFNNLICTISIIAITNEDL